MSTTMHSPTPYDRLCLSLLAPLPNEHDFALNLCTLLSNEGKQNLRLQRCPRLLSVLLAHAGVFEDGHNMEYFTNNMDKKFNKNLIQFWLDCVEDAKALEILIP